MTTLFGSQSTADEVLEGISLKGKHVLITGVTAGLGIETARALVAHGAAVVGTARSAEKAERTTAGIREAGYSTGGSFSVISLDLADLKSIDTCVAQLAQEGLKFDIIIANAGVMAVPISHTANGLELQFGTNCLGHFALLSGLSSLLNKEARIVILSSAAHQISDIDLADLNFEHAAYDKWIAYGRSKTACALLALEFDNRFRAQGIRATAVHPGGIKTELQRHYPAEEEAALVESINASNAAAGLPPFKYKTVFQGAATSVWAAAVAGADEIGGRYCEDCHVAEIDDSDGIHGGIRSYACSPERAKALWDKCEEIISSQA